MNHRAVCIYNMAGDRVVSWSVYLDFLQFYATVGAVTCTKN